MNPTEYLANHAVLVAEQAAIAALPVPINQAFIPLNELLQRLATVTPTLRDAANYLLHLGIDAGGAPAWRCNSRKNGVVPVDAQMVEVAIDRLKHVFYQSQFAWDDASSGPSIIYELYGFDRQQFADFLTLQAPDLLDLFSSLPTPTTDTQPQAGAVVPKPEPIRYDLLATRAQLCAAFGVWGLHIGMFKNLTERQWLMDARKVKGQGQRGNIIEPLFCPFEVMRGLATKTKKPKFSEVKGWDILENRFKAVFEEYQRFDPREQAG